MIFYFFLFYRLVELVQFLYNFTRNFFKGEDQDFLEGEEPESEAL